MDKRTVHTFRVGVTGCLVIALALGLGMALLLAPVVFLFKWVFG